MLRPVSDVICLRVLFRGVPGVLLAAWTAWPLARPVRQHCRVVQSTYIAYTVFAVKHRTNRMSRVPAGRRNEPRRDSVSNLDT